MPENKHWSERALALPVNSIKAIAMFAILGAVIYSELNKIPVSELLQGLAYVSVTFYFSRKDEKK